MEILGKIVIILFGTAILIYLAVLFSTILGGVCGWIVGAWFPYVTDTVRELLNIGLTDFQLGATLGFFGGFFRSATRAAGD
jgi:hypothetical protein